MPRVTMKTVAEHVGVSPMTVSNAFSRPDQLSAALRAKILAAAAALGYAGPDPAARTLARGATGTVGILFSDSVRYALSDEFSVTFLSSIAEELARAGLALTLLPTEVGDVAMVPARDVAMDGAIVYSCELGADGLEWLHRRKLPLVHVDQFPVPDAASINVEDRAGARAAAQHLVDLGHRSVGLLVVGRDFDSGEGHQPHRIQGWRDALDPAGATVTMVRGRDSSESAGFDAVRELLAGPERPTALLCFSDALASGALWAAQAAGVVVPLDLSIVGYDDSPVARRTVPQLTTVRQDANEKGRLAAAELVDAISRRRAGLPPQLNHIVLPTELIVRESTAPPDC